MDAGLNFLVTKKYRVEENYLEDFSGDYSKLLNVRISAFQSF